MRGSQVIVGPTDRGMAKCYDSQSVEERYSSKWLGFKWNHLYALHFSQYVPRLFASTQHKFAKKKQKNVREFFSISEKFCVRKTVLRPHASRATTIFPQILRASIFNYDSKKCDFPKCGFLSTRIPEVLRHPFKEVRYVSPTRGHRTEVYPFIFFFRTGDITAWVRVSPHRRT